MINSDFWQNEGAKKNFSHELNWHWVNDLNTSINILDLGCGYGRITRKFYDQGYLNIIGYDHSQAMIKRANQENSGPKYTCAIREITSSSYNLILCFALFNSSPADEEQNALVELIHNVSTPNSLLYISDYIIDDNPLYAERYKERHLGIHGCFKSMQTVIFRHHSKDHFQKLLPGWKEKKSAKYGQGALMVQSQ